MSSCESVSNLNSLIKGRSTRFAREYATHFVWDEYWQAKWVPRLLISKHFNYSHSREMTLCLSGTVCTFTTHHVQYNTTYKN